MTDLSIVIVSYNVRFFTAQCIASLYQSEDNLNKEIIVVDNASEDGSAHFIRSHFPQVVVIENKENLGFSKANNQGFNIANGRYVLILNPDTIVAKDTLKKCADFLDQHHEYGAVGVRMTDGKGVFLPESRRSLPSLSASIFKFSGLYKLFPSNAFINAYYMGHMPENQDHDTEVLTGAFIFTKKEILHEIQGFDEDFFMYGEDIDLCKRILNKGYKIRYLSGTGITHFKGESTRKDSVQYIVRFYGAMKLYYQKHVSSRQYFWTNGGITASIYILALINWLKWTIFGNAGLIFGFLTSFISFWLTKELWARFFFDDPHYFDRGININLIAYSVIVTASTWLMGWFDKGSKAKHLVAGSALALGMMLVIYAIVPEQFRYSRAIIFIGLFINVFIFWTINFMYQKIRNQSSSLIIASEKDSGKRILELLSKQKINIRLIGFVHPSSSNQDTSYLDNIDNLEQVIANFRPDIVVLNAQEIGMNEVGQYLTIPGNKVRYLLTSLDEKSFIETAEHSKKSLVWEVDPLYNLSKPVYRRLKRLVDVKTALIILLLFPLLFFIRKSLLQLSYDLIAGSCTLTGYAQKINHLPSLPKGYFNTNALIGEVVRGEIVDTEKKADICYAKYYTPMMDIYIIYKSFMT